uniref:Small EDRK-rich factor-like N-terminal domain-containing protein n=1 Tax=Denticeps clupeoides TaxID=299321 RepID=A0AAY4D1H0_9TELE
MAHGQQKIQSQQKNAKKAAEKKQQGADQKTAAKAALVHTCPLSAGSASSLHSCS